MQTPELTPEQLAAAEELTRKMAEQRAANRFNQAQGEQRLEFDVFIHKDRVALRFSQSTGSLILTINEARKLALTLRQLANRIERNNWE